MRQQGLNVVARIKYGQVDALREVLKQVQDDVDGKSTTDPLIRFGDTPTHLARMVLIDFDPGYPPQLIFSSNHDGKRDEYLDQLIKAGPGLDAIWSKCKGYPEKGTKDPKAVKKFFNDNSLPIPLFYVCYPGITVKSAKNALDVFGKIGDYLDRDRKKLKKLEPGAVIKKINTFVEDERLEVMPQKMPWSAPIGLLFALIGFLLVAPLVGLAYVLFFQGFSLLWSLLWSVLSGLGGLIALIGIFVLFLNRTETNDTEEYHRTHTSNYVPSKVALEQEAQEILATAQTQMTLVDPIRQSFTHRLALKIVLALVNFLAKYTYNQGVLVTIRTVHFARWFPIDDGERLIFLSNFDDSWQQYIGAFVDQLTAYLTAIWSNTIRFPPTKYLFGEGAEDMESFMQFIREFQIPAGVFYSAYSKVSAQNIVNAVQMREKLGKKIKAKDQEAWLRLFAGPFAPKDQKYPGPLQVEPQDPKVKDPGNDEDIQAWIFPGYKRGACTCYLFLKITEGKSAREWLREVADVTTSIKKGWPDPVNIAFTAGGLEALGLPEDALLTFPTAFRQGIAQEYDDSDTLKGLDKPYPRSLTLGDTGDSAPVRWDVGGTEKPFDVLVILHAANEDLLKKHEEAEKARIEKYDGIEVAYAQTAHRLNKKAKVAARKGGTRDKTIFIEHFGFRDGIAEPAIRDSGFNKKNQITTAAGEFILGYKNQYGFFPPTPSVRDELDPERLLPRTWRPTARRDLGRNGTFVVFRKMPQDVPAFWEYFEKNSKDQQEMIHLASRSVGRWPDGTPLTLSPDKPDPQYATIDEVNHFLYLKDGDTYGYNCPFASHIRRSNPRDSLGTTNSLKIADRHHIMRRGTPYGECLELPPWDNDKMPKDDGTERGLMFFCFNTSFRRQFEFVQIAWNNSARFNGLYNSSDPVIGPQPSDKTGDLTLEAKPFRDRYREITRFTGVSGGAYLFLPSISALKFLARLPVE